MRGLQIIVAFSALVAVGYAIQCHQCNSTCPHTRASCCTSSAGPGPTTSATAGETRSVSTHWKSWCYDHDDDGSLQLGRRVCSIQSIKQTNASPPHLSREI